MFSPSVVATILGAVLTLAGWLVRRGIIIPLRKRAQRAKEEAREAEQRAEEAEQMAEEAMNTAESIEEDVNQLMNVLTGNDEFDQDEGILSDIRRDIEELETLHREHMQRQQERRN